MSEVFLTSDTHFLHKMVAGLRGYDDVREHDEDIIDIWNRHVTKRDIVWHLGDVSLAGFARMQPILSRLNGTIHLVAGNHDLVHPMHRRSGEQRKWMERFSSIHTQAMFRVHGRELMLSHFPLVGEGGREIEERYSEWRMRADIDIPAVVHGHVHSDLIVTNPVVGQDVDGSYSIRHVHVGWDAHARPVRRDEVYEWAYGSWPVTWPVPAV